MQLKFAYPRWYQSFRGFVVGLAVGIGATTLAYESKAFPVGNPVWQQVFFPLVINGLPWVVLALFEIYFGIQHFRALRRKMDGRAVAE